MVALVNLSKCSSMLHPGCNNVLGMNRVQDVKVVKFQADLDSVTQGFATLAHHLTATESKLKVSILSIERSHLQSALRTGGIAYSPCLICHCTHSGTAKHVNMSCSATYSRQGCSTTYLRFRSSLKAELTERAS